MLLLATDIAVFAVKSYFPTKDIAEDEKEMTVNIPQFVANVQADAGIIMRF